MNDKELQQFVIKCREKRMKWKEIGKLLGKSEQSAYNIINRKSRKSAEKLKNWTIRKRKEYPKGFKKFLLAREILPEELKIWNKRKRESLGLPLIVNSYNGGLDFIRQIVRQRDNNTCQKCFIKWIKDERKFDVHHLEIEMESSRNIKYDRENMDKMITLCHKCHLNLHSVKEKMRFSKAFSG